ncbi:MAG: SDR family NAD(P)-dependent oxidoreductase [Chloroflexota bacterium]|nr:SDR family NAD(P)-dependent oxidoreductase [Chloroflexota bacterium]
MKLKGQVAIVTGGGIGIGKAISLAFAREGAAVVMAARTKEALEEVASLIRASGGTALPVPTDVSQEGQVIALMERTQREFGKIDILVNNSGIEGATAPVVKVDLADWNQVLAVNLTGAMLCAREVLKRNMVPAKSGNIINISSGAGRQGMAFRSPYCASKWAMLGLTYTLALETGRYNIRVNGICPGAIEGDRIDRVIHARAKALGLSYEECRRRMTSTSPMGRMATAEEVAAMAVFLASPDSGGVTGQVINVNVGSSMN